MNEQHIGNFSQVPNNTYLVDNYFHQEEEKANKVKEETPMTKQMKSRFSFYAPASMIYAFFYAFCLYKNASGITYPFFVIGTLCFFFLSMKKLGVPYKKDSLFYVISIVLLGISNCCTNSTPLLWMNKLGIFLLCFILILHTVYHDTGWNFPKYIGAIFCTIGGTFTCLFQPLRDLVSFFDAKKQEKSSQKSDEKSYFMYILIGIAIAIPVIAIMTALLCSADVVFNNMIANILTFNIDTIITIFQITFLAVVVFFASYALLAALCKKNVKEQTEEKKIFEPVIAITVTGMLSVVYLAFSMIQIFYLFIGNMQLPDGYSYSAYARQGFFQLLAVCIINLILVLFCLHFFKDNMILKVILTVISGCTFIMILSSTLRMLMYIERYNLTFLRIFVLWALAVIFLLMVGVTIYIYLQRFPLFFYSVAVTTVFYIGLSFAHPDYWIARYNLNPVHMSYLNEYDIYDSLQYLSRLSTDAAPILLDGEKYAAVQNQTDSVIKNYCSQINPLYYYWQKVYMASEQINIRNFNFSIFTAEKYLSAFRE